MSLLTINDLKYNLKHYFSPTSDELRNFLVVSFVMALIIGFDDGSKNFSLSYWSAHFLGAFLIILLANIAQESAKRILGLWWGYRIEYKTFYPGLAIGIMITIMTLGKIWWLWILMPSGIMLHAMEGQRLGYFRHFTRMWDIAFVAMMGPIANLVLALVFRILLPFFPGNVLIDLAIKANIMLAISTLLPMPPVAGHNILFASRWIYFMLLGLAITMAITMGAFTIPLFFVIPLMFIGALGGVLLFAFGIQKYM